LRCVPSGRCWREPDDARRRTHVATMGRVQARFLGLFVRRHIDYRR
jgi:hypothetical protein